MPGEGTWEAPLALVQCFDCGRTVSDLAVTCPHCGVANPATPPEPVRSPTIVRLEETLAAAREAAARRTRSGVGWISAAVLVAIVFLFVRPETVRSVLLGAVALGCAARGLYHASKVGPLRREARRLDHDLAEERLFPGYVAEREAKRSGSP